MDFNIVPSSIGIQDLVAFLVVTATIWGAGLVIYRLYFSPIAHFPGPKLTAATGWYETYLDVWKGGQFTFQIEKWHQQYGQSGPRLKAGRRIGTGPLPPPLILIIGLGPIVRITPWEVHIADPDFYEVVFNSKTRYDKIEKLRYRFGLHLSSFDTIDHDHHHRRRSAIFPFFARQKVVSFSPKIQEMADHLARRLATEFGNRAKVVNMNEAYAAFVSDAINYYTFAISYNFLDYPDFLTPFTTSIRKLAMSLHVAGHFPWFLTIMQKLPNSLVQVLNPLMVPVFQFHDVSTYLPT